MVAREYQEYAFPRELESLEKVEIVVSDFCRDINMDDVPAYKVMLAVSELASNIIKYGVCDDENDVVSVTLSSDVNHLIVRMEDDCEATPDAVVVELTSGVSTIQEANELASIQECGWGISLISLTTESVGYVRKLDRNSFTLSFAL